MPDNSFYRHFDNILSDAIYVSLITTVEQWQEPWPSFSLELQFNKNYSNDKGSSLGNNTLVFFYLMVEYNEVELT